MQVTIYGRPGCSYCEHAKQLCKVLRVSHVYKTVGVDIEKTVLEEMVGHEIRTIPQIFIQEDGLSEYVGGYKELRARLAGNTPAEQGSQLNG